jgi:hypothetical protein
MSTLKAILWTGGDAPNKEAKLTVLPTWGPRSQQFVAYWEPGYCGCPDCHPCQGYGATEQEAIVDYWEQWEERHGA